MKHAELEQAVRATLAGRAETVSRGPDWLTPATLPAERGRARRTVRWLAPLAAAAAVAAVVASVIAIEDHSGGRHVVPPATHQPSSGTPTSAPAVPPGCRAALPNAWRQAVANSLVETGGTTVMPLSVTSDGGVLVARDFGPVPGSGRDVTLIGPGGAPQVPDPSPQVLVNVPDPDKLMPVGAVQVGQRLVVAYASRPRPAPNTIPGSTSMGLIRIVVDDSAAHTEHVLVRSGSTVHVTGFAVFDGGVYWDEGGRYAASTGKIMRYDLASGRTTVAYHGAIGYLAVSAGGIAWSDGHGYRIGVPAPLPSVVEAATDPRSRATLATDGTAWAWLAGAHVIGWWSPGRTAPTYVTVPGTAVQQAGDFPAPPVVSGSFVLPSADARVIDVRTGATATLPDYRPRTRGTSALFSGPHGIVVGEVEFGPAGHYVQGYWQDTPLHVLRLDTRGLPGLVC